MQKPDFGQIVATTTFILVSPNGERTNCEVQIGLPYLTEDETWRCPVAMNGLHGRLADMAGNDSVQALQLAIRLVRQLLGYYMEEGGCIFNPQEESELNNEGLDAVLGPM